MSSVPPPPPHVRLFSEPWLMVLKQRIEILIYFVIWRRDLWKVEEICVTQDKAFLPTILSYSVNSVSFMIRVCCCVCRGIFFWKVLYILCNRIKRFRHVDLLDLYCIHIFKINRDVGRHLYILKWAVSKYAPVLSGIPSNIIREKLI